MKKIFLIITSLLIISNGFSQNSDPALPQIINDTLFTTSGYKVVQGQDLKLGNGTLPTGDFKYITLSSKSWATVITGELASVDRKSNGHLFKVKKIRKEGSQKRGFTYYLILGAGDLANYECDIESAIISGEVVVPEEFRPKPKPTVIEIKQQISVADELAKLKKLYDDGVLTKEEYDAQKKKLLEKN